MNYESCKLINTFHTLKAQKPIITFHSGCADNIISLSSIPKVIDTLIVKYTF